ncbi:MAG: NUDIX hydrolase [Syntrophaceae bacterium]|nr:NUDIX hydrolase [Syntrophaceae bacterium]
MEQEKQKLMYRCKIFDVWEEEVSLPHGKSTRQSMIDHKPTVAVVAVNDKKEILLIKQYRNAVKQHLLEIPAGTFDHDSETPLLCAKRELAEETGFDAANFISLFEGYLLPGYCNEYMYFFLAEGLFPAPLPPDEDEFIEVLPTSIPDAQEMAKNGTIIDAKTALGIILAVPYLNGKHSDKE